MQSVIENEQLVIQWDDNNKVGAHLKQRIKTYGDDGQLIHASHLPIKPISDPASIADLLGGELAGALSQLGTLKADHAGALAQVTEARQAHDKTYREMRGQLRAGVSTVLDHVAAVSPEVHAKVLARMTAAELGSQ